MATSYKDIRDAIMARLTANWTATAIHWPATQFKPPTDGNAWIQPRIGFTGAEQVTLGVNGIDRIEGILHTNIFVQIGKGDDEATQHSDTLRALFPRGLRLAAGTKAIIFLTPEVVPFLEDEQWYQLPVDAEFYYDE